MADFGKVTVADMVKGINKKYLLPTIQRKFVWEPEKIENLFDSLMRGFPMGTLLFWQMPFSEESNFYFYKFIEKYNETDTTRERGFFDSTVDPVHYAVLDGQQRMTALYIGLKGSYAEKLKYLKKNNVNAYPEKKLYLNLLSKNDEDIDDDDIKIAKMYDFKFLTESEFEEQHKKLKNCFWFEVGKILEDGFDITDFLEDQGLPKKSGNLSRDILDTLYKCMTSDSFSPIRFYIENSNNLDDVLNIFIRTNDGGKTLAASDLLMSYISAQLNKADFDIEQELDKAVSNINGIGKKKNFAITRDFILKAFLILCNDDSEKDKQVIKISTSNFNGDKMKEIYADWELYIDAIKYAVQLVNEFDFNQSNFASNNSLIPIAHYVARKMKQLGKEKFQLSEEEKGRIIFWFIYVAFNKIFSSRTDTTLNSYRVTLMKTDTQNFPLEDMLKIGKKIAIDGKSPSEQLINLIINTSYSDSKLCRMALTILYWNSGLDFINTVLDVDHVFPKTKFKTLIDFQKEGLNSIDEDYVSIYYNSMANLQFLTASDNKEKSDKFFYEWIKWIKDNKKTFPFGLNEDDYMAMSCIPKDESLHKFANYKEFFEKREESMRTRLKKNLEAKKII